MDIISFALPRKLIVLWIFLIVFLFLSRSRTSFPYEMDLDILRLFLSDRPKTLAMGGFDLCFENEDTDLYHPAKLVFVEKSYISYILVRENVFKDRDGKWENTHIKSEENKLTGVINWSLDGSVKKTAVGFQYSHDNASGHAYYTRDNLYLDYNKTARNKLITFAVQAGDIFSLGGGIEDYKEDRNFFWEAEFRAYPFFSVSIRDFTRKFDLDLTIEEDDIYGHVLSTYSEDVLEFTMKIYFHKLLKTSFVIDAKHLDRKTFQLSCDISKRFCLKYLRQYGNFNYHQDIFVNGSDSGHNNGRAEYGQWIAGLTFRRNERTTYHFDFKKFHFRSDGAGIVESDAVLSFWENLLAGKRYFNYNVELESRQYHFGMESRWTKRLTMRTGLQYIEIKPTGVLDNWTPFPFIGIGRLDEQIREFSYYKITLGILALGLSYRVKNLEFSYGLGQYILLSSKKREDEDIIYDEHKEGEEEKWYRISWNDIKEAWDKIKDNPGGTLHTLEARFYF
ncbi:MAG: hypothetical protein ACMUIU_08570 [bacterium]